jgi:hypothetical protein
MWWGVHALGIVLWVSALASVDQNVETLLTTVGGGAVFVGVSAWRLFTILEFRKFQADPSGKLFAVQHRVKKVAKPVLSAVERAALLPIVPVDVEGGGSRENNGRIKSAEEVKLMRIDIVFRLELITLFWGVMLGVMSVGTFMYETQSI